MQTYGSSSTTNGSFYSEAWVEAIRHGRVRYLSLTGLNAERTVRCIGNVDIELQAKFQNHLVEITKKAKAMRVTTKAGTDVTFKNDVYWRRA